MSRETTAQPLGEIWRYTTVFLAGIVATLVATWFTAWWNAATRSEVAIQFSEIKTSQSVMQKDLTEVKSDIGFIRGRMTEQNELTARLLGDATQKKGR